MAIEDLLRKDHPDDREEPQAFTAVVTETANSVTDLISVKLPQFDQRTRFENVRWSPRVEEDGTVIMPTRGDKALVILSDEGDPWIVEWWPYA